MTIEQLKTRSSIRDYSDEPIKKEDIKALTEVINNSPTSANAQQFSAILITDQETKNFLSKINFGQPHIAKAAGVLVFVGDRTRNNHYLPDGMTDELSLANFQRAMVDASIASAYAQDALITMGYGVSYVGGLQAGGEEVEKFLNLPKDAFVVVGLSFGKFNSVNEFKPKMNKVFFEKYNEEKAIADVEQYEVETVEYYAKRGLKRSFDIQNKREIAADTPYGQSFAAGGIYYDKVIKRLKK